MTTEDRINAGLKPTLKSIHADINAGNWDALYFATENQINTLINKRGLLRQPACSRTVRRLHLQNACGFYDRIRDSEF